MEWQYQCDQVDRLSAANTQLTHDNALAALYLQQQQQACFKKNRRKMERAVHSFRSSILAFFCRLCVIRRCLMLLLAPVSFSGSSTNSKRQSMITLTVSLLFFCACYFPSFCYVFLVVDVYAVVEGTCDSHLFPPRAHHQTRRINQSR